MRTLLFALVFAAIFAGVATQAYVLLFEGQQLLLLGLSFLAAVFTALATVRLHGVSSPAEAPRAERPSSPRRKRQRGAQGEAKAVRNRETGTVKWFSADKGYGFVVRESGEEIFLHHSAIRGRGMKTLADGQSVTFVTVERERGLQAADVEATSPP